MKKKTSAGILLYRRGPNGLEVLLGHPGGPLYRNKDDGVWTIPKGEHGADESPEDAARRELTEETGLARPENELAPLGEVRLRSGKTVRAFACECEISDEALARSFSPGTFSMEWPPRSGKSAEFPELDRLAFFSLAEAERKMNRGQQPFLARLAEVAS